MPNYFSSTHEWANGAIVSVNKYKKDVLNLRIQDANENMLCDVVIGDSEALSIAHSLLSVITKYQAKEVKTDENK